MATMRLGTSGWVYLHWRGLFYPPHLHPRLWLGLYSDSFDSVEINSTFYRLPRPETFAAWAAHTPEGFLFAVKANRFLTHRKKLKDAEAALGEFLARARLLGSKLGPILFQLPPQWGPDLPRFESFLRGLPAGCTYVFEFRDQRWLDETVFRVMERFGVVHCIHDMRPLRVPLRVTAGAVYLRFHGDPTHAGDYPEAALALWAERINRWLSRDLDVYVYFNNDVGGFALKNADSLRQTVLGGDAASTRDAR